MMGEASSNAPRAVPPLGARDFPAGTPLRAFFAWNEARLWRDRRFLAARDLHQLFHRNGAGEEARALCIAHLAGEPAIRADSQHPLVAAGAEVAHSARTMLERGADALAVIAARQILDTLLASISADDRALHAALFRAFERLEEWVDLAARAHRRAPRSRPATVSSRRRILVIKLSALGDFVQALGPMGAIRRAHAGDRITLLTTRPYVELATTTGFFDEVLIDERPPVWHVSGWLKLRRALRGGRFDRVYDLQTSDRSSFYSWLFFPERRPQWSGIAWRCSHPHANLDRYPQHTIDKQAEQLLMAGIFPVPLPSLPSVARELPTTLPDRRFALLIPGSSPRHPEKRWPVGSYAALALRLDAAGLLPVVVGTPAEEGLGAAIRAACPSAIDLVGKTDLLLLARLAQSATVTIGNDTGATHMAAAGGHPVVVLFSRASEPSRCAPRGSIVRIITERDLAALTIDRVFAEVIEALSSREAVPTSADPG